MGDPRATVLIGAFEDLVARGLHALIGDDPSLGVVASGVEAGGLEPAFEELAPSVAVLNLSSLDTPLDVRRLHGAQPQTRILVLVDRPSRAEAAQLLALGATGCLAKDTEARDVLAAIHLASSGLHVLPPAHGGAAPPPDALTPRERRSSRSCTPGWPTPRSPVSCT